MDKNKDNELNYEDVHSALLALESWVDAFQEEEVEHAARVRKTIKVFERIQAMYEAREGAAPRRPLRLVKPEELN